MSLRRVSFNNKNLYINTSLSTENNNNNNKTPVRTPLKTPLKKVPKTPRRYDRKKNLNYCTDKAHFVGKRIQNEVDNPALLNKRIQEEMIIDYLLYKKKMRQFLPKVYRLSDSALKELRHKLSNKRGMTL